ncbi:hypothetical protein [Vibrio phage J14]|nr:hypothetical protein [Vibrio phage J14]
MVYTNEYTDIAVCNRTFIHVITNSPKFKDPAGNVDPLPPSLPNLDNASNK